MWHNLIKDNKYLVYSIVNRFRDSIFKYKTYIDWDEMEQVGMIALSKALEKYDPTKGSFKNYAIAAIKNAIIRQYNFDKRIEQHNDIDIYRDIEDSNTNIVVNDTSAEKSLLEKIIKSMTSSLRTKKIMLAYLNGYSISDIAKAYGCSHQRISQIIYAQVYKIKKRLKNDNTI